VIENGFILVKEIEQIDFMMDIGMSFFILRIYQENELKILSFQMFQLKYFNLLYFIDRNRIFCISYLVFWKVKIETISSIQ